MGQLVMGGGQVCFPLQITMFNGQPCAFTLNQRPEISQFMQHLAADLRHAEPTLILKIDETVTGQTEQNLADG